MGHIYLYIYIYLCEWGIYTYLRDVDVGDVGHGHGHLLVRLAGRVLAAVARVDGEGGALDVAHDDVLVVDVSHVTATIRLN